MTGPWRSERLLYRAVETEDEGFLTTISTDAEAFVNAAPFLPTPRSKKSSIQYREYLEGNMMAAIVCLPPPNVNPNDTGDPTSKPLPIGIVHLNSIDPRMAHHRRSEIGINIVGPYQSQGFGTEAIKWALRWGFVYAGLHRIEINVLGHNKSALRLYERLGFTLEGRKREWLWHEGQWWDMVMLAMLEDEWREKYGGRK